MDRSIFVTLKNPKKSFSHFLLSSMIGSSYKIGWLDVTLKVIAEIQMTAKLLHFSFEIIEDAKKDTFGAFTESFTVYLTFGNIFAFKSQSLLNDFAFILFGIYLMYLISLTIFLVAHYYLNKPLGKPFLQIWNNIGLIHCTIGFGLIYPYFLSLFSSFHSASSYLFIAGQDKSIYSLSLLMLITAGIFAIMFCRFLYAPIRNGYVAASIRPKPELLMLIYKLIDEPLKTFITDMGIQKGLRIALMIAAFSMKMKDLNTAFFFYNYRFMRCRLEFCFIHFSLVVSNLIILILSTQTSIQSFSIVYISAILSVAFLKINDIAIKNRIIRYSTNKIEGTKSRNDFLYKLFALDFVLSQGVLGTRLEDSRKNHYTDYLLLGILVDHRENCKKTICGCSIILEGNETLPKDASLEDQRVLIRILKFELLRELYEKALIQMPNDSEMKIGLAALLFQNKNSSNFIPISLIHTLDRSRRSIERCVIGNIVLREIEAKIAIDNSPIKIKEVVDYQALSQNLKRLVISNIATFLEFWDLYKTVDPSMLALYLLSVKINKEANQIALLWDQILKDFPKLSYPDYLLYGLYQGLIRSAPYYAKKTLKTYFNYLKTVRLEKSREPEITMENIYEPENMIVCITMKKEKLGSIVFVTPNIEDSLQFSQKDLIEKDVGILLPTLFQEKHQKSLALNLEKTTCSDFEKNRICFIRKKNGCVIPTTLYVTIFPYFQDQFLYISILRQIPTLDDFIIILSDGTIDCYTESIGKTLNLASKNNKKLHLRNISSELAKLNKVFLAIMKDKFIKSQRSTTNSKIFSRGLTNLNSNIVSMITFGDSKRKKDSYFAKEREDNDGELQLRKSTSMSNAEDIRQRYEAFTSFGVPVSFNRIPEENRHSYIRRTESKKFTFHVTITEEVMLDSHFRIFRLRPLASGEEEDRLNNIKSDKNEQTYLVPDDAHQEISMATDHSKIEGSIPADNNVKLEKEVEVNFSYPFPDEIRNTIVTQTLNPEDLLSPKSMFSPKDPLLPQRGFTSEQKLDHENDVKSIPINLHEETKGDYDLLTSPQNGGFNYQRFGTDSTKNINTYGNIITLKNERGILDPENSTDQVDLDEDKHNETNDVEKVHLKKFLKDQKILTVAHPGIDRTSMGSTVKVNKINSKVETAIYLNENDTSIRFITIFVLVFCVISIVLFIYAQITTSVDLTKVQENVQILEFSYERLYYIGEINRRSRRISFILEGLASNKRHVDNYIQVNQNNMVTTASNLSYYNYQLRNSIYNVDVNKVGQLYKLIKEKTKENANRFINSFDLCIEISNAALDLYNLNYEDLKLNNTDLSFILDNSLDDLVSNSQDILPLLRSDNTKSLNRIQSRMIGILGAISGISAVIFLFVLHTEMTFIKKKTQFLDIFLKIKDYEIETHLYIVRSFYNSLKDNKRSDYFAERMTDEKLSMKAKTGQVKQSQNKNIKTRRANYGKINTYNLINLAFASVFLIIFIILFGTLLSIFNTSKISISDTRIKIVDAKVICFNLGLLMTGLYEYITKNGTGTLRGHPIAQEWEAEYSSLTGSNSYLSTYIDKNKSPNTEIELILTGNLCSLYFANSTCLSGTSGLAGYGLLAMDAFLITALRGVKDFFDSSNRTKAAMQEALAKSNLLLTEVVYESYVKKVYAIFDTILQQQLEAEFDSFKRKSLIVIIVSALLFLLSTKFIWLKVCKRMEEERKNYRNILRIIPVNVILGNRYLKHYLFTHSKKVLDSVKNKI